MLRYDLLGAVKYPKKALRAVQPCSAIAVLDRVFDKTVKPHNDLYRRILKSKKKLTLVVHCNWSSSHAYYLEHEHDTKLVIKRLQKIAAEIPGAADRIYVSPYLERRDSVGRDKSFKDFRALAPEFKFINSMIGKIRELPGTITEIHHDDWDWLPIAPYIFSTDGIDPRKADMARYRKMHKGALQFGMWAHEFNGKQELTDGSNPLTRTNWPSAQLIKQMGDLA